MSPVVLVFGRRQRRDARQTELAVVSLGSPAVSAFPERVIGSACALSFSRLARRSLALRLAVGRSEAQGPKAEFGHLQGTQLSHAHLATPIEPDGPSAVSGAGRW